jgi:hypothetical protein
MIRGLLISSFFMLPLMMFYYDLHAMRERKKDKSAIEMSKNNKVTEQNDESCRDACLVVPTVFCTIVAMNVSDIIENYLGNEDTPGSTENLCKYGILGAAGGIALGSGAYKFYAWLRSHKEKQG